MRLAHQERVLVTDILKHLREARARRLFADYACSSLFEYIVKFMKNSPAAAQARIDALRLTDEVPEAAEKLASGSINLTQVGELQRFIRAEEKVTQSKIAREAKLELINKIENKSVTESVKLLLSSSAEPEKLSLEIHQKDRQKQLTPELVRIEFTADPELQALLNRYKELNPGLQNYKELFKKALREQLKKIDPIEREARRMKTNTEAGVADSVQLRSTEVSQRMRDYLLKKANHRCTYVSRITGQRCECRSELQVEHIVPRAKNGSNNPENLTILCRQHNLKRAIEEFGRKKMQRWIT